MTIQEFDEIGFLLQTEIILFRGITIASRRDEDYIYELFQVDSFYVEVRKDPEHELMLAFRFFENDSPFLDLYIDAIDISKIA